MISLIPKNDIRQALRVRRTFIALAGYLVIFVGYTICYHGGFIERIGVPGILLIFLGVLLANSAVLILFYTGVNQHLKDPSLTVLQLLIGIALVTVLSYYMASTMRGAGTVIYVLVFVFGTFRLRLRDFLIFVGFTTVLYAWTMAVLAHNHPEAVNARLEWVRTAILMIGLLWISYIANYIANLRRKIKQLASHDALTDVYNRREIFEILEREKAFSDRSGYPFSLCILDLDNFKIINDTYGHQAGDAVLKSFARVLKENIRSEDYVGRYGGEEFLVVFVNFEYRDNSTSRVQRLLKVTNQIKFPDISESLDVTVSIGVAAYQPEESIDDIILRADEALYRAKANGKNRIEYNTGCAAVAPPDKASDKE
ncbi:MAG: GGDEF domain-containing protein [Thermodesulfobacteriota bacterium]|nr:GGDEF domain-containing protein [Thermodesulfobacteriota bacterium]